MMLLFIYKRDTFATQKQHDMSTIMTSYSRFADLVLDRRTPAPEKGDYGRICASLGVRPEDLDFVLEEELGMKGPEILDCMQKLLNL